MVDIEQKKSSTVSSLYIGSTIDKPNVDLIINAVATILHSQMIEVYLLIIVNKLCLGLRIRKIYFDGK